VTVVVQFIVDKEGNVSDVEALSGPAPLQKEAIRVIRLSGKWEPAIQNGRPVRSYKKQPITVHWEN
jgi:protein TonB